MATLTLPVKHFAPPSGQHV